MALKLYTFDIMSISVIMPVYNAAPYLEEAIQSCLQQPEVSEIILIDDGSTDDSHLICERQSNINPIIKLYTHPNHKNLGISASRNLGIKNASKTIIAFLDTDDYYLEGRFEYALEYLHTHPTCMALAESIEAINHPMVDKSRISDMTITNRISSSEMFYYLATSETKFYSFNGMTLKRDIFNKIGYFDTSLKRGEDTDFLLRLAWHQLLHAPVTGRIVAKYRRHNVNPLRNDQNITRNRKLVHEKWLQHCIDHKCDPIITRTFLKRCIINDAILNESSGKLYKAITALKYILNRPALISHLIS